MCTENMKPFNAMVLCEILFCLYISAAIAEDIHHEEPMYNHQQLPLSQGVYMKKFFKYVPEKDNWQQKFAETISKAIEDEKGEDFSHTGQGNVLQKESDLYNFRKESSEVPQIYEKPSRTQFSGSVDPHLIDTGVFNETSNAKSDSQESKPNVLHIPTYHSGQQFADNEKGEILIHRPAPIIVNRPPTKVLVNHPPLIVKPAPVIFHRPPSVIVRQVFVKPKPEPMKMQPVYVKVIKPAPEKIYIKEHISCGGKQHATDYEPKYNYYPSQYSS